MLIDVSLKVSWDNRDTTDASSYREHKIVFPELRPFQHPLVDLPLDKLYIPQIEPLICHVLNPQKRHPRRISVIIFVNFWRCTAGNVAYQLPQIDSLKVRRC